MGSRLPAPSCLTLAFFLDSQKEPAVLLIKKHQVHNRFMKAELCTDPWQMQWRCSSGSVVTTVFLFHVPFFFIFFLFPPFLGARTCPADLCVPSLLCSASQIHLISSLTPIQTFVKQTFTKLPLCAWRQHALLLRHQDERSLNPLSGDSHGMERGRFMNKQLYRWGQDKITVWSFKF